MNAGAENAPLTFGRVHNLPIIRLIDGINEVVGRIVSIVAIVFAGIIIYDVFMRYFMGEPTRWAFDVTKQLYGFYFIMLGGYALRHQAHVRVDLVTERLGRNARRWVEAAGYVIFFFPFAWVFARRSWDFAMTSYGQGEVTYGAVQLPVYPLKMAMFVAAVLLLIQGVSEFLKLVLNKADHLEPMEPLDVR
ncbi:TRAP transporter small permease subunit [Paracoccus sp. YLB-12]|jgi:TRAP-type mannitol/chloroaromatic compound transport system permease small subunit|uniref:TRAP transporter small permease protein n=1 Tax=Paracoccus maritimus TaxID=2933292 RepID=A0ABT2K575_9RHOB|nr:TRAP transporter small permease subunit [Paracoccus sp. YLB-12]MCT4331690.1 TRAP transporter small permease subunit [Paracoccus sp. YLB-12]